MQLFLFVHFFFEFLLSDCHHHHVSGSEVTLSDLILFISHRWGSDAHPDPDREQFELVVRFIQKCKEEGTSFKYVWLDYSCICQVLFLMCCYFLCMNSLVCTFCTYNPVKCICILNTRKIL